MKKFIMLFFSILMLTHAAGAVDDGFLHLSQTGLYEEFLERVPEIADTVKGIAGIEGMGKITEADVDLDAAYPYYTKASYFSPDIHGTEDFQALVAEQEYYYWLFPITKNGKTALVAYMRKYPISEMAKARYTKEELAEAEAKVGTWVYQWTKVVPEGTDWKSQMLSYGMDADQITLVSAVPAQEAVMGVCVRDGQLTDVVSLSDAMFEVEREGVEAFGLDDDGVATVQIGDIFSYEQAQDCFGRLELKPGAGDGLIGSRPVYQMVSEPQTNGTRWLWIALPVAVIAAVGIYRKRTE